MRLVTPLVLAAVLALAASNASAAGVNLAWNDCNGDGGSHNRAFACNTNTGTNLLVGSYVAPAGITGLSGNEVVLDLQSAGGALPSWWMFKVPGTCRTTAMSMNFVASPAAVNCADYWQGQAAGGIGAYTIGFASDPSRARIVAAIAIAQNIVGPLVEGTEYFSFNLAISNVKTVGNGSCAGCSTPVCLVLNQIKLTQPVGVGDYRLTMPGDMSFSNAVTWQSEPFNGYCMGVVPARNATWGQVKSLYR